MITIQSLIDQTISHTGDSDQHAMTLFSLILQIKGKNILELGVRSGFTTRPMFAAAKLIGARMTSVDLSSPNFDVNELSKEYSNYTFVMSDAIQFLKKQVEVGEKYDFIFIDDWHCGLHVAKELELIDKLTDNRSIITLHDLMAHSEPLYNTIDIFNTGEFGNGGPYTAVNNLDKKLWEYCTIPVNNGLTILRKI
jgi:predicted O-methyltransferase YrrM